MATDPSLPGELRTAASRVGGLEGRVANTMSSAIASRMMLALAWSGVASDRDDLQMNTTTSALSAAGKALGALATQLEGAAGAADQQLVAEAAAAKAAAAKAAAAKAAAAKPKT